MSGSPPLQNASREAIEALTRIEIHEIECARRYAEIKSSIDRIHQRFDDNGRDRTAQFLKSAQTNKMILSAVIMGSVPAVMSVWLHFWK